MTDNGVERSKTELLPCPFCGGKADLFSVPSPAERGQVAHRVICRSPHCAALGYFKTEEGAIKAWNTRAKVPDVGNRYAELFGTPERAAQTLAGICESCKCGDCATCGVPEWADYSHDYGQLLEWLRGDA